MSTMTDCIKNVNCFRYLIHSNFKIGGEGLLWLYRLHFKPIGVTWLIQKLINKLGINVSVTI